VNHHPLAATVRRGFTLVELLIVIAIIAILAALLIPAVNSARESARKTTCASNLRNFGLAVLNFETQYQKFPPAATARWKDDDRAKPLDDKYPRHSIMVYLLPFFEEGVLYKKVDIQKHWNSTANLQWEKEFNLGGLLICPSTSETRFDANEGVDQHISKNQVCDYVPAAALDAAYNQTQPAYNNLEIKPLRQLVTANKIRTDRRGAPRVDAPKWQGVLRLAPSLQRASVRHADVRDGLSTTMMFFEDAGRPEHNANRRRVFKNPKAMSTFRWANWQMAITINRYCGEGSLMNCENYDEIYSFHPGGSNIVFADGSMHFVNESIDPETFVSLYTAAGGDFVKEDEVGF
jgi:prepilin-type N-terminal cleavage/methylation domain-containing protein/prepilin-type processing-associated H-X9-DG protein